MRKRSLSLLAIIMIGILLISGCGKKLAPVDAEQVQEKETTTAVKVANVTKTTVESVVSLNGKVKPIQEISVMPKTPGKVSVINFEIGDQVNKGDVLFTLEQKDIQLQVDQARAALSMSKIGVEQQLTQLNTSVTTAETNYNDTKINYNRMQELFEAEAISEQQLEMSATQLKIAEEQYKAAKKNLELTEGKNNAESASKAQYQQALAGYNMAKSQLDNTVVTSPITGIVATKNIVVGGFATSATPSMSVVDLSSVTIDVNAPENIINKVKVDDKVDVYVEAAGKTTLAGTIVTISPVADTRTQSYPIQVKISNEKGLLKGGMFAEIKLVVDKAENTLAVPLASIINKNGKDVLYIVDGERAQERAVEIGYLNDKLVQILDGVNENETIVVKGQNFIHDDSKVSIANE